MVLMVLLVFLVWVLIIIEIWEVFWLIIGILMWVFVRGVKMFLIMLRLVCIFLFMIIVMV